MAYVSKKRVALLAALGVLVALALKILAGSEIERQPASFSDEGIAPVTNAASASSPSVGAARANREFSSVLADIRRDAESGNASAQRRLADIYGSCSAIGSSPEAFLHGVETMAELSSAHSAPGEMAQVAKNLVARCAALQEPSATYARASRYWLEMSADRGDLAAKIMLAAKSESQPTTYAFDDLAAAAISGNDERSLFELGQLLLESDAKNAPSGQASFSGVYDAYALSIVACRTGLDCGQGSRILDSICLGTSSCSDGDFEEFVRQHVVPPSDQSLLDSRIDHVAHLVSSH